MKTVVILFIGLISHMNLTNSNTSVLVAAPNHNVTLSIIRNAQILKQAPLENTYVTISGASGSFRRSLTLGSVPPLSAVAGCATPKQTIVKREYDPAVSSYVDFLDGGELSVAGHHPVMAHIENGGSSWKNDRCASCEVSYTAELTGDSLTIAIYDVKTRAQIALLRAEDADTVAIRNAPDSTNASDHFQEFFKLFEACTYSTAMIKEASGKTRCALSDCDPHLKLARSSKSSTSKAAAAIDPQVLDILMVPSVECTNSQWP